MAPNNTQYWVVMFQLRAEAIRPLGFVYIGVIFLRYTLRFNIQYHHIFTPPPSPVSPPPVLTKRLWFQYHTYPTINLPPALLATAPHPVTGLG